MATNLPPGAYKEGDPELPRPEHVYPPGVVKVSLLYGRPMSIDPEYCNQQQQEEEEETKKSVEEVPPPPPPSSPLPQYYIDPDTGETVAIPEALPPPPPPPGFKPIPPAAAEELQAQVLNPSPSKIPMPPPPMS